MFYWCCGVFNGGLIKCLIYNFISWMIKKQENLMLVLKMLFCSNNLGKFETNVYIQTIGSSTQCGNKSLESH